jgi:hypothetical protein
VTIVPYENIFIKALIYSFNTQLLAICAGTPDRGWKEHEYKALREFLDDTSF